MLAKTVHVIKNYGNIISKIYNIKTIIPILLYLCSHRLNIFLLQTYLNSFIFVLQWDPIRLKTDSLFVMGARANK